MIIKKNRYDVTGIGSALLDFMVAVDDPFLKEMGLRKRGMHLIDEARSRDIFTIIYDLKMEIIPGGSSANTVAGLAALGGKGAFVGRVADDDDGASYIYQTTASVVESFITRGGGITGHAITFITPDLERTFATYLGAAIDLSVDNVDEGLIRDSSILHLEGYLFEADNLRQVCYKAMNAAKRAGRAVSIDLADPGLIERAGAVLEDAVDNFADIVFVNENEALKFTGAADEEEALELLAERCSFAAVKLGERGSLIKTGGGIYRIPSYAADVVNTNGAGDMYAAGILYGLVNGFDPEKSGRIGSYAASLVVASPGARYKGAVDLSGII